jgi:hypothetical protein
VKHVALTRSDSGGEQVSLTSLRAANRAVKERHIIKKTNRIQGGKRTDANNSGNSPST